jgi:hypothetical protein
MNRYHFPEATQIRCSTTLTRFTYAYLGTLQLEDGRSIRVKATFSQEHLLIDAWSLQDLYRAHTVLHRVPKLDDWQSDFSGLLNFGSRRYETGARLLYGARLKLRIYFRLLLHTDSHRLEIAR